MVHKTTDSAQPPGAPSEKPTDIAGYFEAIRQSCPGIKGEMGYAEFRVRLAAILEQKQHQDKQAKG